MRVPALLTAALVLAACGTKAPEGEAAATNDSTPPVAMAPMGATHTIQMVESKFDPIELTIKAGDVVEFKNVSGGSHNIVFIKDSIPPNGIVALANGIADKMDSLTTSMIMEGASGTVSFKDAPVGEYHFFCQPHMGAGMRGKIIVQ